MTAVRGSVRRRRRRAVLISAAQSLLSPIEGDNAAVVARQTAALDVAS